MKPSRRAVATAVAMLAVAAAPAVAQVPEVVLSEPEASYPEPLSLIGGVRELSDGALIVSDPLEESLLLIEADMSTGRKIGRNGQGPKEYGQPDGVFAIRGDSTLMVDLTNGRFARLAPDGSIGDVEPIAREDDGQMVILLPRGADAEGNIYYQPIGMRPGQGIPDSADVARWNAAAGAVELIAKVKRPGTTTSGSGGANNRSEVIRPVPLSPQDVWAVGPDGSVAIARSTDYHVEWVRPNGDIIVGPPVAYEPVRVGRADKEAWVADMSSAGIGINVSIENGVRQTSFSRGGGAGGDPDVDDMEWPEVMPAFASIQVDRDGNAWVRRYVSAGSPIQYDVFDSAGQRVRTVILPAGSRIESFGAGAVYVSRTDDLEFRWLSRYTVDAS